MEHDEQSFFQDEQADHDEVSKKEITSWDDSDDGDYDDDDDSDSTEDNSLEMTNAKKAKAKAKTPKTALENGRPIASYNKALRGSLAYYEASSAAMVNESRSTRWKKHGKPQSNRRNQSSRRRKKQLIANKKKGRRSLKREETIRIGCNDFGGLWAFAFKKDYLQFEQLIEEDNDREKVASFCEEPFWKIIFHWKGTVLTVIVEDVLFWMTLAVRMEQRTRTSIIIFYYCSLTDCTLYRCFSCFALLSFPLLFLIDSVRFDSFFV